MKQLRLYLSVSLLLAGLFFGSNLLAQTSFNYTAPQAGFSVPKDKDAPPFKDRLWFGGGLTLGFFGGSGYSSFGFGLSPMVGYKIIGPLSAGPRVSVLYTSQKFPGFKTFNLFDVELSLFARVKIFKGLFAQGEIGSISDQYIYEDSQGLGKGTRTRPAQNIGLGYNFSNGQGGVGQEIAIMYDLYIGDTDPYEQPWNIRLAFTYGF